MTSSSDRQMRGARTAGFLFMPKDSASDCGTACCFPYTHPTLPTNREVEVPGVGVLFKKKKNNKKSKMQSINIKQ